MTDLDKSVGGKNRHSFWCNIHEQRRFYGSCLCLVNAYNAKRLNPDDRTQDCAIAMQKGRCEAVTMRDKEIEASKSLYYLDPVVREEIASSQSIDKESDSYKRGWAQVGASLGKGDTIPKRELPSKTFVDNPKKGEMFGMPDMSSIISQEIKKENSNLQIKSELKEMKVKIIELSKTDINAARELLIKAKKLEARLVS